LQIGAWRQRAREGKMEAQEERTQLMESPTGSLPIRGEEFLEERVPVSPGGTLFVDLDRGSVEVTEHDREEVHIRAEARGWGAHLVVFHLARKGDDLELDADIDSWLARLFPGTRVRVSAEIPPDYSLDIRTGGGDVRVEEVSGGVTVQTAGGSVKLRRVAGSARLRTEGGSIRVEELEGNLRAQTAGGSIRGDDVAGWVEARTGGGNIDLVAVDGPVEARTGGGGLRVSFVDEPEGTLETAGGSLEVGFPDDAGADLEARTSGGTIHVEHGDLVSLERSRRRLIAKVNGGGPPLVLRTSGGSIRVQATESGRLSPRPR
jgi:hypothetical protein